MTITDDSGYQVSLEPEEEDLVTTDHKTIFQGGKAVCRVVEAVGDGYLLLIRGVQFGGKRDRSGAGDAVYPSFEHALKAFMEDAQFWPDVWWISDHGNAHLIDMSEAFAA